jgi:NAD(P)-dependent dehydrogenase (short-subunit alcohol dehydrogenase family)
MLLARTLAVALLSACASDSLANGQTVVVVTGANRGLGALLATSIARYALDEGRAIVVVLACRRTKSCNATADGLTRSGLLVDAFSPLDVRNPRHFEQLARYLKRTYGGVDAVIANAGFRDDDDPVACCDVNVMGFLNTVDGLVPIMRRPGRVVAITSSTGHINNLEYLAHQHPAVAWLPNVVKEAVRGGRDGILGALRWIGVHGRNAPPYDISKGLLNAAVFVVANELGALGIEVSTAMPGFCATRMTAFRGTDSVRECIETTMFLAIGERDADQSRLVHASLWRSMEQIGWENFFARQRQPQLADKRLEAWLARAHPSEAALTGEPDEKGPWMDGTDPRGQGARGPTGEPGEAGSDSW